MAVILALRLLVALLRRGRMPQSMAHEGRAGGWAVAAPVMVLMGFTSGAASAVPVAFRVKFCGTRSIGAIKATAATIMGLGSAIGPGLTGALIDASINFPHHILGIAAYILLAYALVAVGVRRSRRELALAAQVNVIGP